MAASSLARERATVAIRDFQPEDYEAVVGIRNLIFPDNRTSVEQERFEDEAWDAEKYVRRKYVALDRRGTVVGESAFSQQPGSFHPQRFALWIAVHPERHRRGIGTALYDHALREIRALHGTALRMWAKESMTDVGAWIGRRGFKELMRAWESRLDVAAFDRAKFATYWGPPAGVDIASLAEERQRTAEALRKMFDLDNAVAPDMPRVDPHTPMDFDMYRKWVLESPGSEPRAIFIAKDGDAYVGITELFKSEAEPGVLYTGLTGVRRGYRGRGVAFAVKLRALDWAKQNGYREVRTWNSTLNAPMLGINVKLGFVKQPAWITFGKDLIEA